MTKDKSSAKQVREVKGQDPVTEAPGLTQIEVGNVPILTVRLLDAINKNLMTIIQQNAIIVKAIQDEGSKDGGS